MYVVMHTILSVTYVITIFENLFDYAIIAKFLKTDW